MGGVRMTTEKMKHEMKHIIIVSSLLIISVLIPIITGKIIGLSYSYENPNKQQYLKCEYIQFTTVTFSSISR